MSFETAVANQNASDLMEWSHGPLPNGALRRWTGTGYRPVFGPRGNWNSGAKRSADACPLCTTFLWGKFVGGRLMPWRYGLMSKLRQLVFLYIRHLPGAGGRVYADILHGVATDSTSSRTALALT